MGFFDNLAKSLIVTSTPSDVPVKRVKEAKEQFLQSFGAATAPFVQKGIKESVTDEWAVNPTRLLLTKEIAKAFGDNDKQTASWGALASQIETLRDEVIKMSPDDKSLGTKKKDLEVLRKRFNQIVPGKSELNAMYMAYAKKKEIPQQEPKGLSKDDERRWREQEAFKAKWQGEDLSKSIKANLGLDDEQIGALSSLGETIWISLNDPSISDGKWSLMKDNLLNNMQQLKGDDAAVSLDQLYKNAVDQSISDIKEEPGDTPITKTIKSLMIAKRIIDSQSEEFLENNVIQPYVMKKVLNPAFAKSELSQNNLNPGITINRLLGNITDRANKVAFGTLMSKTNFINNVKKSAEEKRKQAFATGTTGQAWDRFWTTVTGFDPGYKIANRPEDLYRVISAEINKLDIPVSERNSKIALAKLKKELNIE